MLAGHSPHPPKPSHLPLPSSPLPFALSYLLNSLTPCARVTRAAAFIPKKGRVVTISCCRKYLTSSFFFKKCKISLKYFSKKFFFSTLLISSIFLCSSSDFPSIHKKTCMHIPDPISTLDTEVKINPLSYSIALLSLTSMNYRKHFLLQGNNRISHSRFEKGMHVILAQLLFSRLPS